MTSFNWGEQFVTGLSEVDIQHRKLVAMVNGFGELIIENNYSKESFNRIFQELADYAQEHFQTEEKLLERMQIDTRHVKLHTRQHADFVSDISSMAEFVEVDNFKHSRSLLEYLIHWLAFHILGTDQNMARQVAEIENGVNPKGAFAIGERAASNSTEPLVVALNGLFSLVSRRNKELRELNQTLEARVAERTDELLKANKALEEISVTDHLTELPNRRFATRQLHLLFDEMLAGAGPLACIMLDADGFKEINDTYGHDAGDAVLQRLAKELKNSVRSDDIVCRLGGDEFIIICPNTDLEGVSFLAEQVRKHIASLKVRAGHGYWLGSVSIGVACSAQAIGDVKALLKAVDDAVYEAKRCGKNRVKQYA